MSHHHRGHKHNHAAEDELHDTVEEIDGVENKLLPAPGPSPQNSYPFVYRNGVLTYNQIPYGTPFIMGSNGLNSDRYSNRFIFDPRNASLYAGQNNKDYTWDKTGKYSAIFGRNNRSTLTGGFVSGTNNNIAGTLLGNQIQQGTPPDGNSSILGGRNNNINNAANSSIQASNDSNVSGPRQSIIGASSNSSITQDALPESGTRNENNIVYASNGIRLTNSQHSGVLGINRQPSEDLTTRLTGKRETMIFRNIDVWRNLRVGSPLTEEEDPNARLIVSNGATIFYGDVRIKGNLQLEGSVNGIPIGANNQIIMGNQPYQPGQQQPYQPGQQQPYQPGQQQPYQPGQQQPYLPGQQQPYLPGQQQPYQPGQQQPYQPGQQQTYGSQGRDSGLAHYNMAGDYYPEPEISTILANPTDGDIIVHLPSVNSLENKDGGRLAVKDTTLMSHVGRSNLPRRGNIVLVPGQGTAIEGGRTSNPDGQNAATNNGVYVIDTNGGAIHLIYQNMLLEGTRAAGWGILYVYPGIPSVERPQGPLGTQPTTTTSGQTQQRFPTGPLGTQPATTTTTSGQTQQRFPMGPLGTQPATTTTTSGQTQQRFPMGRGQARPPQRLPFGNS